tara:strand:- start:285 stop:584 length:300 start_codon:yes stop_codon:yes gene_type:complete
MTKKQYEMIKNVVLTLDLLLNHFIIQSCKEEESKESEDEKGNFRSHLLERHSVTKTYQGCEDGIPIHLSKEVRTIRNEINTLTEWLERHSHKYEESEVV